MRNKRLNVLFIAVIALAAAPQALEDARRLAHEAHEWAETEFWSVFLSRQTPGTTKATSTQLLADARTSAKTEDCPLARVVSVTGGAANGLRRALYRSAAQQPPARSWRIESADTNRDFSFTFDERTSVDEVAEARNNAATHPKVSYENDKTALRLAGLHARDAEKVAEAVLKASLASSFPQPNERAGIRMRRIQDAERSIRRKARFNRGGNESETETPEPQDTGSM